MTSGEGEKHHGKQQDARRKAPPDPPPPRTVHRALRLVGWNVLFLIAGLALIGVVGEAYFRLTVPSLKTKLPVIWSPTVGLTYKRDAEVYYTNSLDFWVESRTNSLGRVDEFQEFLDD